MDLFDVEAAFPNYFYVEIYSPSVMIFSVKIPSDERYALLLKEIGGLIPALMIVDGKLKQGIEPDQSDIELINKFFSSHKFFAPNANTIALLDSLADFDSDFDSFVQSRQPIDDDSTLIAQEYVFRYCKYDPQHGDRDWKTLLESNRISEVDLLVAQRALASGESEATVNEMLYHGSPAAQQLPNPTRAIYATTIVAQAIECHTSNGLNQ
jgi:hypothetical protein